MSDTITVDVKLMNTEAAAAVALSMGATILGNGTHRLYSSTEVGFGIKLPGWNYPIVIKEDGVVSYDNYKGMWGSQATLDQLVENYALYAAKAKCEQLGWYHELDEVKGELIIHHPDGGTVTVGKNGTVDATGFVGSACSVATSEIASALGQTVEQVKKPEFEVSRLNVTETED